MVKNVSDKNTQNSARIVHVTDVQNIIRQICSDEVKAPDVKTSWSLKPLVFSADLSSLSGEQKGSGVLFLSWEFLFRLQTSEHIQDDLVAENVLFLEREKKKSKCYTQKDSRSNLDLKV